MLIGERISPRMRAFLTSSYHINQPQCKTKVILIPLIFNLIQVSTLVLRPSEEMWSAFPTTISLEPGMEPSISGCHLKKFMIRLRPYLTVAWP